MPLFSSRGNNVLICKGDTAENLLLGFAEENSNRIDKDNINNLTDGQVVIFPQRYVHFELNFGCKPAKFISALNHEDPG